MKPNRRAWRALLAFCVALAPALLSPARATPWAEVGDAQLRSDIEVLAAAGVIDNVTTQWPLAWGGIIARLQQMDGLDDQPEFVRAAAERVEEQAMGEVRTDRVNYEAAVDTTNLPNVVRGFDGLGRQDVQGDVSAEYMGSTTAIRVSVGAQTTNIREHQTLMLDGSYLAQRFGNVAFYAGYQTHWWGPGWDTALSLSNNARPFPQIGYRRLDTKPLEWPILRWLGPWDHEQFVGFFDDPRLAKNTIFHGMRWTFNPFKGFEISIARLQELCGSGHPCTPLTEWFSVQNSAKHQNKAKDEANLDFRYTNTFEGLTYAIYNQEMNRDTGPFQHSFTSHVFGASIWVPVRSTAVRFTAEYASTISTTDFFSFGNYDYGITYSDFKYVDGWQYRGRTLGSSLDTDSRLASFHASWIGPLKMTYTLSYYRADISSPLTERGHASLVESSTLPPVSGNLVTAAPVSIDIGEVRVKVPIRGLTIEAAVRLQDDQPRPQRGFAAAGELSISYRL